VSLDLLELAAAHLGPLVEEVAFLGGASLALWTDDPGAPDPRVTMDVDVVVVVDTRGDYYRMGDRLREQGFREDDQSGVLCRWTHDKGLILDVMPTDDSILGFSNRWYRDAVEAAQEITLPSGATIRAVTPPYLLATKLEAFRDRGGNDYLASVDFEDVVRLVDGRERLIQEAEQAPQDVRHFIATQLAQMLADEQFEAGVAGALMPDAASQARREQVLARVDLLSRLN
jgi:hypothetical protein